jgi:predicted 3-demethylubiquinone-9 3-methyltransferase (glyoxalase superfamily)
MTVSFRLEGQEFTALNGGPHFKFTEAISFVVRCETQADVDHYWDGLREGAGIRGCHSPRIGWITAPGSSWPQSTRIVQRKRRPTSNVDSMMVLRARRGGTGSK